MDCSKEVMMAFLNLKEHDAAIRIELQNGEEADIIGLSWSSDSYNIIIRVSNVDDKYIDDYLSRVGIVR